MKMNSFEKTQSTSLSKGLQLFKQKTVVKVVGLARAGALEERIPRIAGTVQPLARKESRSRIFLLLEIGI